MSRLDSARIASIKAQHAGLSLQGTAVASDAFFPFRDGLDVVVDAGATCVIQPGGRMRDARSDRRRRRARRGDGVHRRAALPALTRGSGRQRAPASQARLALSAMTFGRSCPVRHRLRSAGVLEEPAPRGGPGPALDVNRRTGWQRRRSASARLTRPPAPARDRPAGRRCARCRRTAAPSLRSRRTSCSSSGDSCRCVVDAGCVASDLASPMLTRRVNSCSASRKRSPPARPPLTPKVSRPDARPPIIDLHQRMVGMALAARRS